MDGFFYGNGYPLNSQRRALGVEIPTIATDRPQTLLRFAGLPIQRSGSTIANKTGS